MKESYELECNDACPHYDSINRYCWVLWDYVKHNQLCRNGFRKDKDNNIIYEVKEIKI